MQPLHSQPLPFGPSVGVGNFAPSSRRGGGPRSFSLLLIAIVFAFAIATTYFAASSLSHTSNASSSEYGDDSSLRESRRSGSAKGKILNDGADSGGDDGTCSIGSNKKNGSGVCSADVESLQSQLEAKEKLLRELKTEFAIIQKEHLKLRAEIDHKALAGAEGKGNAIAQAASDRKEVAIAQKKEEDAIREEYRNKLNPRVTKKDGTASDMALNSKLTVVLMSYPGSKRFHLLSQIIARARSWPFVSEVLLVWNGDIKNVPASISAVAEGRVEYDSVPNDEMFARLERGDGSAMAHDGRDPAAVDEVKEKGNNNNNNADGGNKNDLAVGDDGSALAPLTILPQPLNRVDNRWRIGYRIRTEAVLNMDDDIDLRTDGAQCLFDVWRSSPDAIVGIDVRSHFSHKAMRLSKALNGKQGGVADAAAVAVTVDENGPFGPYGYAARDTSVKGVKKFSITLPRSLVTNRNNLLAYDRAWRNEETSVKKIVDELLCDDIAFNFVANQHHDVPLSIYAKANYRPYSESQDAGAMFNKPGMKPMRQKCVNQLAASLNMTLKHRYWHVICSVDG